MSCSARRAGRGRHRRRATTSWLPDSLDADVDSLDADAKTNQDDAQTNLNQFVREYPPVLT